MSVIRKRRPERRRRPAPGLPGLLASLLLAGLAGSASGQLPDADLPIQLDADSSDFDRRNSRLVFRRIKVTQGAFGIEAEKADSADLEFRDSTWVFSGNVRITAPDGLIRASRATLDFSGGRLAGAVIEGSPARFEREQAPDARVAADRAELTFTGRRLTGVVMTGEPATFETVGAQGEPTLGEAARVDYDLAGDTLTLAGDALLREGDNRISGNSIVYNLTDERVLANGGEDGDRVRITIIPPPVEDEVGDGGSDELVPDDGDDAPR